MKKIFLFSICLIAGEYLLAQTCPQIQFDYDESGNRKQRKLGTVACRVISSEPEASALNVGVYPNPTQAELNVVFEKPADENADVQYQLHLYDVNGKEVYSLSGFDMQIKLDMAGMNAGSYFLHILRGDKKQVFTIMKN